MDRIKSHIKKDGLIKRLEGTDPARTVNSIKKEKSFWTSLSKEQSKSIINTLKEEYKKYSQPILDVSQIRPDYNLMINDESIQNPFIINSGLVKIIKNYTKDCLSKEQKARAIFNWMQENIEYKKEDGYKNSTEVLKYKRGVCGEMAFLYITMARSIGLKSGYVEVDRDYEKKKVNHACASVEIENKTILVDPAYHQFDIQHIDYNAISDREVLGRFNQWRNDDY